MGEAERPIPRHVLACAPRRATTDSHPDPDGEAGVDILTLSTADVAVTLRPAQGGRLTGLTDRRTGVQWLHEGRTGHPFVPAMAFRDGARGGFDECLPSVAACPYPDPQWGAAVVADHGDFWSWPWTVVSQSSTTITLDTRDVEHPLLLTRNVTVGAAGGVRLTYGLRNRSALPYLYLYSAHPLFALPDGGRLDLPPAPLRTAFGARLRPGTQSRWPYVLGADAGPFDYSDLCRDPTPSQRQGVRRVARLVPPGPDRPTRLARSQAVASGTSLAGRVRKSRAVANTRRRPTLGRSRTDDNTM